MANRPVITFTTDFGTSDWFAGTMKGVVLRINPSATLVDITHGIPAGNIRAGAFALAASYRFFPKGTVHVALVDPGVGSQRRAIAVQTADYFFVGPDNGVLSWALRSEQVRATHSLENRAYVLLPISRTFHGRDIFAPVAAHLSRRTPIRNLGPPMRQIEPLAWPGPERVDGGVKGEIVHVDHFGNALTNLTERDLAGITGGPLRVQIHGKAVCVIAGSYDSVSRGNPVAVLGSSGFLEVAIRDGNAARRLRLRIGQPIVVKEPH
jgi:S-adenosyl-L-methionine hydrolase (adenosine-forming)